MSQITRDDLIDLRELLSARLERGFDDINTRLDVLNGRTRVVETDVAVLKSQDSRDPSARWGALGAGMAAAAGAVWHWFKG